MRRRPVLLFASIASLLYGSARADAPAAAKLGPRILHVPPEQRLADQGVLTPVPVSIEVPADLPARRVLVHYKVHGASEWRTLELLREGTRYTGAIPCLEVSTITGDLLYYIRIHDVRGAVVAFVGTRSEPFRIRVHHESERPDLYGKAARCPDPADCPPGLPGCPSAAVERIPCVTDADCEGGQVCGWDGYCSNEVRRKNWIGIEIEQDIGLVSTTGACSLASQENDGYACYRDSDGATYLGTPVYTNEAVKAGFAPTRVHLSYDRLIFYDTSVGVKAGYAFRGAGPTPREGVPFMPFSGELHATHWFGDDPFAGPGLRPYLMFGAGLAQFDVKVKAHVRENPTNATEQGGNDLEQTLTVWKRAGDAYVVLAGGVRYPLSAAVAPGVEIRVYQVFPFGATVIGASSGLSFGF